MITRCFTLVSADGYFTPPESMCFHTVDRKMSVTARGKFSLCKINVGETNYYFADA